ncbi:uncharacterized protein LOC121521672 [Cheilinus undulatus]|uniref:uncharacterized protein LOC121521672 n=1 Tax=Cheilinus undulatus TaxID=241271 RepID=UPI001BD4B5A9|nr:uncharacterized protein LOC121521672 [Cheilinus undulatus]
MALFGIVILLIAAAAGEDFPSFTVRVRDNVTLPCGNLTKNKQSCDKTSWLYNRDSHAKTLVKNGKITGEISKDKAKRLNVLANCSLVIKNVTTEDVGVYICKHHNQDPVVSLSVINIESEAELFLFCSVLTYSGCWYSVQWMYKRSQEDIETNSHTCSADVSFKTPHLHQKSNIEELLYCKVTDNRSGQTLLFNVPPSRGEETTEEEDQNKPAWWPFLIVAAVVLVILIVVVVFIRRKKAQGNKTQRDDSVGQSLNPAETQPGRESSQESADPEDGVAYVSVSFTKKRNRNSEAQAGGDDDDGTVTYSTVKVSSNDNGAFVNPSSLYATVNKPE